MPMSIGPGADFWQALGWHPEPEQLNQLNQLQTLLRDWNGRVNLTRLVEGLGVSGGLRAPHSVQWELRAVT